MGNIMTSRERVQKAIVYEEPDRVPIDIGGTKVTGICIDAYVELKDYLQIKDETPIVYEQFGMLARISEKVKQRLYADVVELENVSEAWGLENRNWKKWETGVGNIVLVPGAFEPETDAQGYVYLKDKKGNTLAYMPPKGLYFERACSTKMSDTIKKMDPMDWKNSIELYREDHLRIMEKNAGRLFNETEYSVHGGFLKGMLGSNGIFAGHTITDWLCLLLSDPDYIFSILQATAERAVENLELYLQAVGSYIDTILISGTDFGTQRAELINPELFKQLYVPNYKLINDYVHTHSKAKTMYHCCGSIWNLIDYFIEAGVDILNPVQVTANNMDPQKLKEHFGGRIVFWGGGVDTQSVMPFETPEKVKEQVKERIDSFAPGGGFVFAAIHNLQYGVPPENIITMVDAVNKYGKYPVSC